MGAAPGNLWGHRNGKQAWEGGHLFPPGPSPSLMLGNEALPRKQRLPMGVSGPGSSEPAGHGWTQHSAECPPLRPTKFSLLSSTTRLLQEPDSQRPSPFVPVPRPGAWLPLATTADAQVGVQPRLLSRVQPGIQDLPPGRPTVALTSYLVRPPFQPCIVASMVLLNRNEVTALGDSALPRTMPKVLASGFQALQGPPAASFPSHC